MLKYLKYEAQEKNVDITPEDWGFEWPKDIPKQTNSWDCGIFVGMIAALIAEEKQVTSRSFCQNQTPMLRRKILELLNPEIN